MLDKRQWSTGVSVALSVGAVVWICSTLVDLDKRTTLIAFKVEESNKQIRKNLVLKNIVKENVVTWDNSEGKKNAR
jgi:hypothetical protein